MVRGLKSRRGKYGCCKYKGLATLEAAGWLPSRELIILSGVPFYSIARSLSRWVGFDYIQRKPIFEFGFGTYSYRLAARGAGWLKVAREELPAARRFEEELKLWQEKIRPRLPELMAGPFKDVVNLTRPIMNSQKPEPINTRQEVANVVTDSNPPGDNPNAYEDYINWASGKRGGGGPIS